MLADGRIDRDVQNSLAALAEFEYTGLSKRTRIGFDRYVLDPLSREYSAERALEATLLMRDLVLGASSAEKGPASAEGDGEADSEVRLESP